MINMLSGMQLVTLTFFLPGCTAAALWSEAQFVEAGCIASSIDWAKNSRALFD
jgi:hypothetical protein